MKFIIYCTDGVEMTVDFLEQTVEEVLDLIADREDAEDSTFVNIHGWCKYVPSDPPKSADYAHEDDFWQALEEANCSPPTLEDLGTLEEMAAAGKSEKWRFIQTAGRMLVHGEGITTAWDSAEDTIVFEGTQAEYAVERVGTFNDMWVAHYRGSHLTPSPSPGELEDHLSKLLHCADRDKLAREFELATEEFKFGRTTYTLELE